jgi:hypothetical protein
MYALTLAWRAYYIYLSFKAIPQLTKIKLIKTKVNLIKTKVILTDFGDPL